MIYTVDGVENTQTFSLVEGNNSDLIIVAYDGTGNAGSLELPPVIFDPPNVDFEVITTIPEVTNQTRLVVEFKVDGVVQTQSFELIEGVNQIILEAEDSAGNVVERVLTIELDTIPPVILITNDISSVSLIPYLYVEYIIDGEDVRYMTFPLAEGNNANLRITAMDSAGNESFIVLPNVKYEESLFSKFEENRFRGTYFSNEERDIFSTEPEEMELDEFRSYVQTLDLSFDQMVQLEYSLSRISSGASVYKYVGENEIASYVWMESGGTAIVFSFENNTLLLGEILGPVLTPLLS